MFNLGSIGALGTGYFEGQEKADDLAMKKMQRDQANWDQLGTQAFGNAIQKDPSLLQAAQAFQLQQQPGVGGISPPPPQAPGPGQVSAPGPQPAPQPPPSAAGGFGPQPQPQQPPMPAPPPAAPAGSV